MHNDNADGSLGAGGFVTQGDQTAMLKAELQGFHDADELGSTTGGVGGEGLSHEEGASGVENMVSLPGNLIDIQADMGDAAIGVGPEQTQNSAAFSVDLTANTDMLDAEPQHFTGSDDVHENDFAQPNLAEANPATTPASHGEGFGLQDNKSEITDFLAVDGTTSQEVKSDAMASPTLLCETSKY
ncbi:unnamed protein product, partial [Amoebophrya sp. A25]|eukprot:GSA25T00006058001.1